MLSTGSGQCPQWVCLDLLSTGYELEEKESPDVQDGLLLLCKELCSMDFPQIQVKGALCKPARSCILFSAEVPSWAHAHDKCTFQGHGRHCGWQLPEPPYSCFPPPEGQTWAVGCFGDLSASVLVFLMNAILLSC